MKTVEKIKEVKNEEIISGNDIPRGLGTKMATRSGGSDIPYP